MATITMSASLLVGNQSFGQQRYDISEVSEPTGAQAVRLFGPPRWRMSMSAPRFISLRNAGLWEAMLSQLRGGVNVLAAWDVNKPAPLGTARGTPTLSAIAAAGATSISVTGFSANGTLLAGDWLQIGAGVGSSQLVKVVADVTLNGTGAGTVTIEPPLRQQFAGATAITWDKALGYYRLVGKGFDWQAIPGFAAAEGFESEFLETFSA